MNTDAPIVFVIDDDPSVRQSLARLLRSAGHQVESFADPAEFLARANGRVPGCLVLDLGLPGLNGLDLQERLRQADCRLPVVFITGQGDIPASVRAMKAGAIDFLTKPLDPENLLTAIRNALETDRRDRQKREEVAGIMARLATLTPRETQVLRHVIAGSPNKLIAAALGTVEKTVKVHRARAVRKMQAESLADLVRLAHRAGVSPAPATPISPPGTGPEDPA